MKLSDLAKLKGYSLSSARLLVGNSSGVPTDVDVTGDITITNAGVTAIGSGKVTEAMQVLADNTTNNVSTTKHGYAPKAPNDATYYLDGTGAYSIPAGGGGGGAAVWTDIVGDSSTESIPNTTWTKITKFITVNQNSGTYWDTTNKKLTPAAGKYVINVLVQIALSTTAVLITAIYKNGTLLKRFPNVQNSSTVQGGGTVVVTANGTDYFEVYAWHSNGSSINAGGPADSQYFQAYYIGS